MKSNQDGLLPSEAKPSLAAMFATVAVCAFAGMGFVWAKEEARPPASDQRCRSELLSIFDTYAKGRHSSGPRTVHTSLRQTSWRRAQSSKPGFPPQMQATTVEIETYQNQEGMYYRSGDTEYLQLQGEQKAYYVLHALKQIYVMSRREGQAMTERLNEGILEGQTGAVKAAKRVECSAGPVYKKTVLIPDSGHTARYQLERIVFESAPGGRMVSQDFFFSSKSQMARQRLDYLGYDTAYRAKPGFMAKLLFTKGRLNRALSAYALIDKTAQKH